MSTVLQYTTLASGSSNTSLYDNRQALINDELAQSEGTKMELALTINSSVANQLQSAAATINHQANLKGVLPWTGNTDIAFVTGTNTVALRWTKGQPFIWILISILVVTAIIWLYLEGWRYSKGEFVNVVNGQTATPGQFFQNQVGSLFLNPAFILTGIGLVFVGVLYLKHQEMEFGEKFVSSKAQVRTRKKLNNQDLKYRKKVKRLKDRGEI